MLKDFKNQTEQNLPKYRQHDTVESRHLHTHNKTHFFSPSDIKSDQTSSVLGQIESPK